MSKHPTVLNRTCEFHPSCALAMDLPGFSWAVNDDTAPFKDRAMLEELLAKRMALIVARGACRAGTSKDSVYDKSLRIKPEVTSIGTPELNVPFVRDAQNRPTVRVLYTGSLFLQPGTRSAQFQHRLASGSYRSPTREYQFVAATEGFDLPAEDPAVPIVGTLYGVSVHHQTAERGLHHLTLWNVHSLPPPLLWIVGLKRDSSRDRKTLAARDTLDRAGFNPDECPVIHSQTVDSALDALVAALDEQFASGVELRQKDDTPYAASVRLLQHLKEQRWDRVDNYFQRGSEGAVFASHLSYAYSIRTEAVLADCIERMLASNRALMACELLSGLAVRDATLLQRVLDGCIAIVADADGEEFKQRLRVVARALGQVTRRFPLEPLWSALMDTSDLERARALGHVICSCGGDAVRAEIRKRLDSLIAQSDHRTLLAKELLNHMTMQDSLASILSDSRTLGF